MDISDLSPRTDLYLKLACEWRSWETEGGCRGRRKTGMALLPGLWTHACPGFLVQLAPFSRLPGPEVSTGAAVHTDAAAAAAVVSNIVLFAGMEVRTGIVVFKTGVGGIASRTEV